jgi:hypothetical protein
MSSSLTKSVKSGIQSVKTLESKVHTKLSGDTTKMILRVLIIAHIFVTKYLPSWYLGLINNLSVRIVMALLVVYLAFIDLISAALLAMLFIFAVQEVSTRKTAATAAIAVLAKAVAVKATSTTNNAGTGAVAASSIAAGPAGVVVTDQVPQSSYGSAGALVLPGSEYGINNYQGQVGDLEISREIQGGQGVQVVNGVPSVKVNMEQVSSPGNLTVGNTDPRSDIEGFQQGQTSDEYDHPVNKTLTENVKILQTGYVTPKNLLDAQINGAQGAEVQDVVPASVGTFTPVWNAQGMAGDFITAGLDPTACGFSAVA